MTKSFRFVGIASVMHFAVDAICLCILYIMSETLYIQHVVEVFLTYNILAFMSQPLTGIVADKIKRLHRILIISLSSFVFAIMILLLMVNFDFLNNIFGVFSVATCAGIGNSLFHVWGAKQTVLKTGNDLRALGLFVSTGALGLAFAAVLFSWALLYSLILLFGICNLVYMSYDNKANLNQFNINTTDNERHFAKPNSYVFLIIIIAIIAFVCFRSYAGEALTIDLNKNSFIVLTLGFIAMIGKISGGWLAKNYGVTPTFVTALIIVIACFFLKKTGLIPVFMGVYMINTTMPITLYWINLFMKGREAFAFGILAAALIPGYILAHI